MWFPALVVALPLLAARSVDLPLSTPDVVRGRVAPIDTSALAEARVHLAPFPDVGVEGVRDALVPFGPESFVWVGHAAGDESSSIVLSVTRGVLSASLRLGSGQFRVRPAAAGYRVEEVQPVRGASRPATALDGVGSSRGNGPRLHR